MSFRNRLTLFFVLIVIVPMASLTVVLFRLIADNENGKQDAGVAARQRAAINLYENAKAQTGDALVRVSRDRLLATALRDGDANAARARATTLLGEERLKRIQVVRDGSTFVDVGSRTATFPATGRLSDSAGGPVLGTLQVSTSGPRAYAALVRKVTGLDVVISREGTLLADTLAGRGALPPLPQGPSDVTIAGQKYRAATFDVEGFAGSTVKVAVLDSSERVAAQVGRKRAIAVGVLLGFFALALLFALLVSRSLQRQIQGFLVAARRIGAGDFGTRVPTVGNDEFAALGDEFNEMSAELERKIAEVESEQARLALAMRRIGETFASNLDRDALLEIVLRTAVDGAGAAGGRATLRTGRDGQLHQVAQAGSLDDVTAALRHVEAAVLEAGTPQEATAGGVTALAHPLRAVQQDEDGPPRITGIVAIARPGTPFRPSERELFHYLAGQASVSIENVGLHEAVERQAVTDELTGLANRRRFQEVLAGEVERARRFGQSVGLMMLDIDNFKKVNDTYGHPAGDLVLREVARVLRESAREIDHPARYGGEELCSVLPGTDLEGAYQLAERVRIGIEELRLPIRTADDEPLRVTASFGVATYPSSGDDARGLIDGADAALYEAKHSGKNRVHRAAEVPSS